MSGVVNLGFYAGEPHECRLSLLCHRVVLSVLIKQHFGETLHIRRSIRNPRTDYAARVFGMQVAV